MTYRLNPEIAKIQSPVRIRWNGISGRDSGHCLSIGTPETWEFDNGNDAAAAVFDRHFNVISYRAENDTVVIEVFEFVESA